MTGRAPSGRATHEPGLASRPGHAVSVPNAECVGCGLPLTIPAHVLETEETGFHCAGCYFVGAPR